MTDKPTEFKTFEAAVEIISLDGKKMTAVDKDGILYSMLWKSPYIDERVRKLQVGYYRQFTCEVQGDYLVITNIKYLDSPDWVKAKYSRKGSGGGKPRNERLIVVQTLIKTYVDLYINTNVLTDTDFDTARKDILKAVEEDVDRIMKAGEQK